MRRAFIGVFTAMIGVAFLTPVVLPEPADAQMRLRKVIKKNIKVAARRLLLEMKIENSAGYVAHFDSSVSGNLIATHSEDGRLRLWNLQDGRQIARSEALDMTLDRIKVSPGEDQIYLGSSGKVYRASIASGLRSRDVILENATGFRLSDDNRVIASFFSDSVKITDLETLSPTATHQREGVMVSAIDLAQGGGVLIVGYNDGVVRFVETLTGAVLQEFAASEGFAIDQLVYDQISDTLFTLDHDGGLYSYTSTDGLRKSLATEEGLKVAHIEYDKLKAVLIAKTADGKIIAEDKKQAGAPLKTLQNPQAGFKLVSGKELMIHNDSANTLILTNYQDEDPNEISLISTTRGWATLDSDGYYDGSNAALDDMSWAAEAVSFPIENFTEEFYRSDMLGESFEIDLETGDLIDREATIKEGVLSPPQIKGVKVTEKNGNIHAEITVIDTGGGIRNLRVRQNGMLVAPHFQQDQDGDEDDPELKVKYVFPSIRGKNIISANASTTENIFGNAITVEHQSTGAPTKPDLYIVGIGVNDYQIDRLDLNYAVPDANGMLTSLRQNSEGLYGNIHEISVMDGAATRDGIVSAVRKLEDTRPEDTVIVYFAGHGVVLDGGYYLLPHDYSDGSWGKKKSSSIAINDLSEMFLNIGARKMMLLLDACKSGAAVRHLDGRLDRTSLRKFGVKLGVHVVAATTQKQFAAELDNLGHGIFTYSALQALNGEAAFTNNDNFVTTSELADWLGESVPEYGIRYANHKQYPMVLSSGFDFTLTRTAAVQ